MGKLKKIFSLFFFDIYEKNFINYFKKKITRDKNSKKKVLLVSVINDYYFLSRVALLSESKYRDYEIIGYWPFIIKSNNYHDQKLISLFKKVFRPFYYYLLKKKWSYLYWSVGVKKVITPEYLEVKYSKKLNENYLNIKAQSVFNNLKTKKDVLNIKDKNAYFGDLIYDSYLRYRNVPTVNIKDKFLKQIIYKSFKYNLIFKQFSKEIDIFFSIYSSYTQHGLPVRSFLQQGIKVITDGNNQYNKILTKRDYYHVENYKNFRKEFKKIKNKNKYLSQAKLLIENYFFNKKQKTSIYNYLKINPYQKTNDKIYKNLDGVIFLPNFFESQREWGKIIFDDFYEWIFYTLEIVKSKKLKIMLKPHPNIETINPESKIVINEIKKRYPDLKWIDQKESNHKIFKSIKFGISTWGTILWELAYFNKTAICIGDHPGLKYNFTLNPKNKLEYKKILANINKIKSKKINKKILYEYIFMYMLWNNDAIKTSARDLKLKDINWQFSDSLDVFLKRYLTKNNLNNTKE